VLIPQIYQFLLIEKEILVRKDYRIGPPS